MSCNLARTVLLSKGCRQRYKTDVSLVSADAKFLEDMTGTSASSGSSDGSDDDETAPTHDAIPTFQVLLSGIEFPRLEFESRFTAAMVDHAPDSVARTKPAI